MLSETLIPNMSVTFRFTPQPPNPDLEFENLNTLWGTEKSFFTPTYGGAKDAS